MRTNFHEETYFKYSERIRLSKFSNKDVSPVAIFFCKRLKTSVYKANEKQIKEIKLNIGKFLTSSSKISNCRIHGFHHSKILSIKQFSNVLHNLAKLVKFAKFFSRENYFLYGSLLSAKSYQKGNDEKVSKFFQTLMKFSMRSCQNSFTALCSINLYIHF